LNGRPPRSSDKVQLKRKGFLKGERRGVEKVLGGGDAKKMPNQRWHVDRAEANALKKRGGKRVRERGEHP